MTGGFQKERAGSFVETWGESMFGAWLDDSLSDRIWRRDLGERGTATR